MVEGEAGRAGGQSRVQGGAHFPLCVFTDNVSRRSPQKLAKRNQRLNKFRKRYYYAEDYANHAVHAGDETEQAALEPEDELAAREHFSRPPNEQAYYWPQPILAPGQNEYSSHWDDRSLQYSYHSGIANNGAFYQMYVVEPAKLYHRPRPSRAARPSRAM